jgi:hypothetical protein
MSPHHPQCYNQKAYVFDHQHRHTENGLEWSAFNYVFEQVDDTQSTLEEILTDVSEHAEDSKTIHGDTSREGA